MGWLTNILPIAATILALTMAAGAGVQRSTLKDLRDVRDDLTKQRDDLKSRLTECETKAQNLSSENTVLRGLVTNEVLIKAISDVLDHHHQRSEAFWSRSEDRLEHIEEVQVETREDVRAIRRRE